MIVVPGNHVDGDPDRTDRIAGRRHRLVGRAARVEYTARDDNESCIRRSGEVAEEPTAKPAQATQVGLLTWGATPPKVECRWEV